MPFMTTALVAGGLAAAGGIGGAAIAANAAGNAASTQANAADTAANLQYQAEQQSLGFQKQVWQQQQQNIAPWLQQGAGALSTMDQLMGLNAPNIPANYGQPQGTSGTAPNPFGPTHGTSQSKPPNSFAPNQGTAMPGGHGNMVPVGGGITSAGGVNGPPMSGPYAAGGTGGVPVKGTAVRPGAQIPGGTVSPSGVPGQAPGIASGQLQPFTPWNEQFQAPTAATEQNDPGYKFRLDQGTQALQNSAAASGDLLSGNTLRDLTQFGQDYASNEYGNVYNRALGQYQQNYNIFENNQANQWNRLAGLAGIGQTAVQNLNSAGGTAASNFGNTVVGSTNAIGQNLNNAAAATASGYVGAGNAWGGALGSLGNMGSMIPYLQMMNGGNPTAGIDPGSVPNPGLTNPAYYGIGG